jgi:hypothetical protein
LRYPAIASRNRRAALIATALSIPIVVIVALALSPGSNDSQPKISSTAVVSVHAPTPSAAAIDPCAQVLSQLPVQLDGYNPRRIEPSPDSGAPVAAWGDPAIVLQCGVGRPAALTEASGALIIDVPVTDVPAASVGPVDWLPVSITGATVFTVVNRAVYIQVTVPKSYTQPPLASLSTAIAAALPAVCHLGEDEPSASPAPQPGDVSSVGPLCVDRP